MTILKVGVLDWELERDDDGHRTYTIRHRVLCSDVNDGPQTVMNAPVLPIVGAAWAYGNDSDPWARCWPGMRVNLYQHQRGEPHVVWQVEQKFTTKPFRRCQDTLVEDPLLEPPRVSGSFAKYTKEVAKDRNGDAIKSSSHELFKGPQVEFDHNRPTVRIEQNVADLALSTFAQMVDTVNDAELWGLDARKIKLDNVSWERLVQGACTYYFKRVFDFSVDYNGFDREILDEGTKALGDWDPETKVWVVSGDADNPQDFNTYKDKRGENARVLLNGSGAPLDEREDPVAVDVEYYDESNFLTLGIPTSLA